MEFICKLHRTLHSNHLEANISVHNIHACTNMHGIYIISQKYTYAYTFCIKNLNKGKFGLFIMMMTKCFVTEQKLLDAFHYALRAKNLF